MESDQPYTPGGLRLLFPDGELDEWLALGDVTDRSVRVWARQPDGPRPVVLRVDGEPVADATLTPVPDHDHVAAVVLSLPSPRPDAAF
ncbi:MAG TPA: hypothetical protein VM344_02870, partial [Vitreimonas sp.]|nr:hypothetical protein [Vitreimonas sp.]